MATIRPFYGLRFSAAAGSLDSLVAPPYDVISPEMRASLAAQTPNNVVAITLPEQNDDDRSKYVKYARSASRLQAWRDTGVLQKEDKPALYRYTQTFSVPGRSERFTRIALLTTIKVESYDKGVVLPHEQTFPKHKEDRLRILEATRSHLESIYGLVEDPTGSLFKLIAGAPGRMVGEVTDPDGVQHQLEVIDDAAAIQSIVDETAPKKVWIADGHHRYETACTFRESIGERDGLVAEDFMMMALSSISDPGLALLPTHRILKTLSISRDDLKAKLSTRFEVEEMPNAQLLAKLESESETANNVFGVALPGGNGLFLRAPKPTHSGMTAAQELRANLDVTILHEVIFEQLLGFSGLDFFDYTRDPDEALHSVDQGRPAAFLMNPPTVQDMQDIAVGGEKMPQKSTYYYPKLLSGLVMWSLNDYC